MTPKALRSIRLALGLSIQQFASALGVAASEVAAMESGEAPIPVQRIAAALEVVAHEDALASAPRPILQTRGSRDDDE